ncbi:MAG TPA: T9SS type A sorting domain-containing protein [Chitinophagaceae bacterium]|nr:T9SS type A sorting domain-containing protein [Chitinophagaceae bacterium]
MKNVLRTLAFTLLLSGSALYVKAQCTVSNIMIQNIRNVVPGPGTCTVTFDASFQIENNNGNKFIFIHAWLQSQYPNYFNCVNGHPSGNGAIRSPRRADLINSFLNIGINNNVTPPVILTTYPPDNSQPMTTVASISKTVQPDGSAIFILQGITTTVPVSCGTPVVIVADVWSSQSANAQVAHCVNCGIRHSAGYFNATGLVNCGTLTYNATLTNNTSVAIAGNYRIYADINGDGYFSPSVDTMLSGPTNFNIGAGAGTTALISGSVPVLNRNQGLFLVLTQTSGSGSGASRAVYLPSTQCSPLPVNFQTFSARRINGTNVTLRWETANEINNRGFAVQRNTNGTWETIAFINSQAPDGNSSSLLAYSFTDINARKDISQYRIQQVDLDGKTKNSEIRTVKGEGQDGKTLVYPNPSNDGTVRIVFADRDGAKNAALSDMSGRVIRQWKITTGNTIEATGLLPGVYMLRIVEDGTREQTVEKIVVTGLK